MVLFVDTFNGNFESENALAAARLLHKAGYALYLVAKNGGAHCCGRTFLEVQRWTEMSGPAPDRVRSSIGDRAFLADVFVEMFEGTPAEAHIVDAASEGIIQPAPDARQRGRGSRRFIRPIA